MKKIVFFGSLLMIFFSCNNSREIKFDKPKWNQEQDGGLFYPYRERMLNDLTANYKLKGLKYSQLVDFLGIPDFKDSISISYKIIEDFGRDIDPVYTKDLIFTYSDSVIVSFKIVEWKK